MLPLEINIPLKVREEEQIILKIEEGSGSEYPFYTGEVNVVPQPFESVELETSKKTLLQNIVVEQIPHYETSNLKGKTFIIGG